MFKGTFSLKFVLTRYTIDMVRTKGHQNFLKVVGILTASVFTLKPFQNFSSTTGDFKRGVTLIFFYKIYDCFVCSVAEPVHFCGAPAPAPACQIFRLRPFSPYIFEKVKNFHGFKKISCFLKPKTIIKRFLKVKSYEQIFFKTKLQIFYENFWTFCNIFYEFTYPEPEPGLKTWAPAPPKSGRSTGSGTLFV
jgi:hypothetical protein